MPSSGKRTRSPWVTSIVWPSMRISVASAIGISRADSRPATRHLFALAQSSPHVLRREWQVAHYDAAACGVPDGCGNGRGDGQQRALAHALRAIRAGPVLVLDRVAEHLERQVH